MSEGQIEPETITEAAWNGAQTDAEQEHEVNEAMAQADRLQPEAINSQEFAAADRQIAAEEAEDKANRLQPDPINPNEFAAVDRQIAAEEAADKAGQLQPEPINSDEWSKLDPNDASDLPAEDLPIIPAPAQPVSAEKHPESNIERPRSGIRG